MDIRKLDIDARVVKSDRILRFVESDTIIGLTREHPRNRRRHNAQLLKPAPAPLPLPRRKVMEGLANFCGVACMSLI